MGRGQRIGRVVLGLAVVAALGASLTGCAGSESVAAADVRLLDDDDMPDQLLDLTVDAEDASMAQNKEDAFVEAVGLYSLRRDDLLQGVLQVSTFTDDADVERASFRREVVQQIGTTVPRAYRMGDHTVYLTTGRRQAVAIWFKGHDLYVLSTRDEYERPLALLREALELDI